MSTDNELNSFRERNQIIGAKKGRKTGKKIQEKNQKMETERGKVTGRIKGKQKMGTQKMWGQKKEEKRSKT